MRTADSFGAEYARKSEAIQQSTEQFRTSLQRHIDKLIEEEEGLSANLLQRLNSRRTPGPDYVHQYAASLLRELRAWIETGS